MARITLIFGMCTFFTKYVDSNVLTENNEDIAKILDDFLQWKSVREDFIYYSKDYPFGFAKFDCARPALTVTPVNVNSLAPWNIRVMAAMGDSLTAGRAVISNNLSNILSEYPGYSFPIGGEDNLDRRATLPNLLAHFSSDIVGPSYNGKGQRHFNVAKSGSLSYDLPRQAQKLIDLMKLTASVNLKKDWKFINIFIGSNDLCKACENGSLEDAPTAYLQNLKEAIILLKSELPRVYINLMPVFNVHVLVDPQQQNPFCEDFHRVSCPCLFNWTSSDYSQLIQKFNEVLLEFHKTKYQSDTFAVAVNPAIGNLSSLPYTGRTLNLAFIALDCFHFAEIAQDLVAKLVWNNLFLPLADRIRVSVFDDIDPTVWRCPEMDCPFFRTVANSIDCSFYKKLVPEIQYRAENFTPIFEDNLEHLPIESESLVYIICGSIMLALLVVSTMVYCDYRKNLNQREELEKLLA